MPADPTPYARGLEEAARIAEKHRWQNDINTMHRPGEPPTATCRRSIAAAIRAAIPIPNDPTRCPECGRIRWEEQSTDDAFSDGPDMGCPDGVMKGDLNP